MPERPRSTHVARSSRNERLMWDSLYTSAQNPSERWRNGAGCGASSGHSIHIDHTDNFQSLMVLPGECNSNSEWQPTDHFSVPTWLPHVVVLLLCSEKLKAPVLEI